MTDDTLAFVLDLRQTLRLDITECVRESKSLEKQYGVPMSHHRLGVIDGLSMAVGRIDDVLRDMKPTGRWICEACGREWNGADLFADNTASWRWACGDINCFGTCQRITPEEAQP